MSLRGHIGYAKRKMAGKEGREGGRERGRAGGKEEIKGGREERREKRDEGSAGTPVRLSLAALVDVIVHAEVG
jgi:hypothetical protein